MNDYIIKTTIARCFIAFIAIATLLFVGFWTLLILALSGEVFYMNMALIFFIILIIRIIVWVISNRRMIYANYILLFITGCLATACGVSDMYKNYVDNIPVVGNGDFPLDAYEPFAENTLAVRLNEESTLKLTEKNLPRIDGATALYPLYSAFVQAVYPEKKYSVYNSEVRGGTTPMAFDRLVWEDVDIIFCAAPSLKQIQEAEKRGKTFRLVPIGKEAFVFFVNSQNKMREITHDQIKDIYSGKITNWKELGGENDDIRAFQRPEGSGSQTMLDRIMGDTQLIEPLRAERVGGMGGIIRETADYKNYNNAIGYTFLFFATGMVKNDQIALLKVNGVYPSHETIIDGTYPFTGDFYAITLEDNKNENVEKFIEWILSEQGQYLIEKTGYIPIKKPVAN